MRILSRSTLRNFWETHPDAEEALKTWYYEASDADWQNPVDVKSAHGIAVLMLVKCIRVGAIRQFALRSVPHQIDNCYIQCKQGSEPDAWERID